IAESSQKVSGACQEFVISSSKVSGACREFVRSTPRVIESLPECVGGSLENNRDSLGVRWRLLRRSSRVGKVT
ncbi:hypothetical protein BHM03_00045917, partial [Ensete ventricosum]